MHNKTILIGNLGQDPKLAYTKEGKPVTNLSLATSERFKGRDGSTQSQTQWHAIVCWGTLAEVVAQHLKKGRQVYVEGRIKYRDYTDRDGIKRTTTEIHASEVLFLSSPPGPKPQQPSPPDDLFTTDNPDEDIPW